MLRDEAWEILTIQVGSRWAPGPCSETIGPAFIPAMEYSRSTSRRKGPGCSVAPKAWDRFKQRIQEITRRAKGVSMETTMEELLTMRPEGRRILKARQLPMSGWPTGSPADAPFRTIPAFS